MIDRLVADYWQFRHATDHDRALWKGDLTYLAEWEDLTPEGMGRRRERLRAFAERAEAARDDADPDTASTLETIAVTARGLDEELEWREHLEAANPAIGIHSMLVTFLPRYPLRTAEHGEAYLEKLHRLPRMLAQLTERLSEGIELGRTPLRVHAERTAAAIDAHLERPTDPLATQPAPTDLDDHRAAVWRDQLEGVIAGEVHPALAAFGEFLSSELAAAGRPEDRAGMVHLPGGEEGYARLVEAHTTVDISAERVHELGLEQVARLEEEYRQLAGPRLGTDDITEIYRRLRDDPALHYTDTDALIADATGALHRATAAMGAWFGRTPTSPCVAETTTQGPLAFYSQPAPDGSKPGRFFFNVSDPSAWGTFQLEAVTFHEGVPGHHLQLGLALELDHLPRLHRELYIAAFNEGWGLYSERLADEMGLYSSDLDRVGMLAADSMRAGRLVVDSGLHALGWSRQQAIDYLLANSPMSEPQAAGEIDRYIGMPGQALGYMVGRLELDRIRAEAERALGDAFSLPEFHDVVLGYGTVPLETVERRVRRWVDGR